MGQDHDLLIRVDENTKNIVSMLEKQEKQFEKIDKKIESVEVKIDKMQEKKLPKWVFTFVLLLIVGGFSGICATLDRRVSSAHQRITKVETVAYYINEIKVRLDKLHGGTK